MLGSFLVNVQLLFWDYSRLIQTFKKLIKKAIINQFIYLNPLSSESLAYALIT
jgi:hypothetical protein